MKIFPILIVATCAALTGRCDRPTYAPGIRPGPGVSQRDPEALPAQNVSQPAGTVTPPPPMARVTAGQVTTTAVLVWADQTRALAITAWAAVANQPSITVVYPDGSRYAAEVCAYHQDWGIAFLSHPNPVGIAPAEIAPTPPAQGDTVFVAGYGPAGFAVQRAAVSAFVPPAAPDSPPHCMVLRPVVPGAIGYAVSNAQGQLVGLVVNSDPYHTYAPHSTPLRWFLSEAIKTVIAAPLPGPTPTEPAPASDPAPLPPLPAAGGSAAVGPGVAAGASETPGPASAPAPAVSPSTAANPAPGGGYGAITAAVKLLPTAAQIVAIILALASGGGAAYVGWKGLAFSAAKIAAALARRRLAQKDASLKPFLTRDTTAGEQLVELARREGESPVLDAIIGRLSLDALDEKIETLPDGPERTFAKDLKTQLLERFNDVAPVVTHPTQP